ncbi:MAG TPA: head GIN domain-containing protein [Roseateles sp.]|uniref:head GIN domain-containing protein n=1 Tax=Roseateles sp. TaxID=1971397 RepID=UPI002ED80D23
MIKSIRSRTLVALLLAAGLAQAQPNPQPHPQPNPHLPSAAVAPAASPAPPAPPAPPAFPAEPGRIYTPGTFDRLEFAGAARVLLVQGERDQVFVAGDADVQKTVDVELQGKQLVIRPAGGWKFWHTNKLFVQVEVRNLRSLSLSGASDLHAPGPLKAEQLRLSISGAGQARLDQLDARQLSFVISGAGDGQIGGRVDDMVLQISGKGKVVADRLQAQRARVSVSGIGNVVVWVTDDLTANISGVGSVDYFGSPNVQRSVSGMGSISAKGDKRPQQP